MTNVNRMSRRAGAALLGIVLTLVLALGTWLPLAALAAPGDQTIYTVRLYAGNRGTVNGQDMVEYSGVAYGDTIDFGTASVAITDGKYYAKGLRPAGQDNVKDVTYVALADDAGRLAGAATVTEDADYVVAYGVLADRVEYTVRYVDANGNELAAAQTFVGDVGDMPVVAARYIENCVPNAYEATRALTSDPAQNVITFTYARLAPQYVTVQVPGGTIDVVTPSGQTVALSPAPAASAVADDATGAVAVESDETVVAPDGTEVITEDGAPLSMPIETLTIEDDATPLAAVDAQRTAESNSILASWTSIAFIAGGVVLLAIVFFVLWRRRRAKADEGF